MIKGKYIRTKKTLKKLSSSMKKSFTAEHKKSISLANKGKVMSQSTKEKIRQYQLGSKRSLLTRKRLSESHRGAKSYLWKGGITAKNLQLRRTFEYKLWREAVFTRDNWTCIWCGVRSAKGIKVILHADHIKAFSQYPELRYSIDNGRTLCIDCHMTTDTYLNRGRHINILSK